MNLKYLPIAACLLPGMLAAQSQTTCTSSISYFPAHPIYGQEVLYLYKYQSDGYPSGNGAQYAPYTIETQFTQPGLPASNPVQGQVFPNGTQQTLFLGDFPTYNGPPGPGQETATFSVQPTNDGLTRLCSHGLSSQTVTVSIAPLGPSGPDINLFVGQYAFLFKGTNPQIKGVSQTLAAVGSLTADGQGHVTGVEDVNSGAGSHLEVPVTGEYTLNNGTGTLTLTSSLGVQRFSFFTSSEFVSVEHFTAGVTQASLVSQDGYVVFGNGSLVKQMVPTYAFGANRSFALNLSGDAPCKTTCTTGDPIYETRLIDINPYGEFDGRLDGSVGAILLPQTEVTGNFGGNAPVSGRLTYTLSQGQLPELHMVEYPIDADHFFTMSTDSHATTYLLSGTGTQ